MFKLKHRILTLVAVGAMAAIGVACSGGDDNNSASAMPNRVAPSSDTAAADLRVGLTALLQEHVYLAGMATGAALSGSDFPTAAAVLDSNSVDLSNAIGSVYGAEAERGFLDLWRKHIGFFVAYTQGKAGNDSAMVAKARADLDGYRADFGAFLASANPNLTKDAVAQELKGHVDTLFAAIDAQAAKDPTADMLLRTAAGHMPHTAEVLAGAIVKQMPEKFAAADSQETQTAAHH